MERDRTVGRRTVLRAGVSAAALALLPSPLATPAAAQQRPHLDAALRAERWIRASRIPTEHGVVWPADPRDPATVQIGLYNGWPGVVLFYLELHHASGDAAMLAEARRGADQLLAELAHEEGIRESGLYTGIAGVAFVLGETYRATRDDRYLAGARKALDLLERRARTMGDGVEWNAVTDIVSGSAGTGLGLLYLHGLLGDRRALDLATRAGRRLIAAGIADGDGTRWPMTASNPRQMPNFSHGTAGVAYFLADLHIATKDAAFLDAARRGATYLQRIDSCEAGRGGACKVFHHTGDGEDLYYLSWCHGPAGTARLFRRLGEVTGNPLYTSWVHQGAYAIQRSGIPEQRTPGFWNNVSVCCGNAGVADFMIQLNRHQPHDLALAFTRRVVDDLMERGTDDERGLRWVQAEHRVQPENVVAQTGYMQGAAGIGSVLLRFDGLPAKRPARVVWPDSPWPA